MRKFLRRALTVSLVVATVPATLGALLWSWLWYKSFQVETFYRENRLLSEMRSVQSDSTNDSAPARSTAEDGSAGNR
jgi:hypothetical protein